MRIIKYMSLCVKNTKKATLVRYSYANGKRYNSGGRHDTWVNYLTYLKIKIKHKKLSTKWKKTTKTKRQWTWPPGSPVVFNLIILVANDNCCEILNNL